MEMGGSVEKVRKTIDVRGVACPMNYVRVMMAFEGLRHGELLGVTIDDGKSLSSVRKSAIEDGHKVIAVRPVGEGHCMVIEKNTPVDDGSPIEEPPPVKTARSIYLDNAASTPLDGRVLAAMQPYFSDMYGNPSSIHRKGQEAHEAVEKARADLARAIHAGTPEEIVFTSSGTEANNFALKGCAFANRPRGDHLVVSAIEHDCVLNACKWLESQGFRVCYLPLDPEGIVDLDRLKEKIRSETIIVSIMHANNEIGVIEPIEEIGRLCRSRGIYFHTDACQSFGKIPVHAQSMNVDLMSINAHKLYGPKGVGALYVRSGVSIMPWQHGGGQESGMRSATENVPGIVGFAEAARLCLDEMETETPRLQALRDRIIDTVLKEIPVSYLNGHRHRRLPTNVNVGFKGLEGQAPNLLLDLDKRNIFVSTGSACSSAQQKYSHVLSAIGRNPVQAIGVLRISLGRFTSADDVRCFLETLSEAVDNLRSAWTGMISDEK